MHFMILILAFLVAVVVWGFFHANPRGVNRVRLVLSNVVILALALAAAAVVASLLYGDALTVKSGEKGMATYLALMAGGTVFLIVVAVGGLLRNLLLFPISARAPDTADSAHSE
ncbi:MAG: hypothetical protein OEW21_05320 [Betaproteobacteria bacterium]|nr:hypothetical protein [Betaproteobacteria bacterium]